MSNEEFNAKVEAYAEDCAFTALPENTREIIRAAVKAGASYAKMILL